MNEKSNYYQNYEPFLGGNDDPILGYNQSYLSPSKINKKKKRDDEPKENRKALITKIEIKGILK